MIETSIVVIAYNRENFICSCFDSITLLEERNFEVVLVNDGSNDKTVELAKQYSSKFALKIISLPRNLGVCAARNVGIQNSLGKYIAFIDSDSSVKRDWLKTMLNSLKEQDLAAISGPVADTPARNLFEESLVGTALIGQNKIQGRLLVGCNMLFKAEILKNFMFDQALEGAADEDDLQRRLLAFNHKISCLKQILVEHNHPISNWHQFINLAKKRGRTAAQLSYKHNCVPRDIIFIFISIFSMALSAFIYNFIYIAVFAFLLQSIVIILNELFFKQKSLKQTLRAFNMLMTYHFLKACFFSVKFLEIFSKKDLALIASKQEWQKRLYNLHKKHSSCCSIQYE